MHLFYRIRFVFNVALFHVSRPACLFCFSINNLLDHHQNPLFYFRMILENAMALIRPISDLRKRAEEIMELAHGSDEPVFITKNGKQDIVLMSIALYETLQRKLELYGKLFVAQAEQVGGDKGRSLSTVMMDLRKRMHTVS